MGKRGPQRRPNLQVVREGNPGHRAIGDLEAGVQLAPKAPDEPDWRDTFLTGGTNRTINTRCRQVARDEWRRVVPQLDAQGLLAGVDCILLTDYCVCVARIYQCERDISERGSGIDTPRGLQKNPSITTANQYRAQLKFYIGALGLSPASRNNITAPGPKDEDDSPWDV
ncbi:MAG TPA: phage terminase small subunit P27 family [Actinomycetota bacterium]|nr:phage terminase small subunit P27 family [Actinomycetota bacterium]